MSLRIYTANPMLKGMLESQIIRHRDTDSGFDIPMLGKVVALDNGVVTFDTEIVVSAGDNNGPLPILLLPRSSLADTPFRLANSIGLIDMGYRGNVKAKVDVMASPSNYTVSNGARYFQLCRNNFMPWSSVKLVELDQLLVAPDNRGSGGFGSTN